jgi:hypothetical protein
MRPVRVARIVSETRSLDEIGHRGDDADQSGCRAASPVKHSASDAAKPGGASGNTFAIRGFAVDTDAGAKFSEERGG